MLKGIAYFTWFSWKNKKQYLLCRLILEFVKLSVVIGDIVLPKYIINGLFENRNTDSAVLYILILLGVNLAGGVLQSILKMSADNALDDVRMCFEQEMMGTHMKCDYSFLESPKFQDLKTKAKQYVNGPFNEFGYVCERSFTLIGDVFTILSVVFIIIKTNLLVLLAFMLFTAVNVMVGAKVKKKNMNLIRSFASTLRGRGYYEDVSKNPIYAKEIRAYGITDFILHKYDGYMEKFCDGTLSVHRHNMLQRITIAFMNVLQQAVAYVYLFWQAVSRAISAGDFTMYLNAVIQFNRMLNEIVDVTLSIRQYADFYKDFEEYGLTSKKTESETGDGVCLPGDVEFRNVTFTYPGQSVPALRNVTVKIPYGQKVSLIGENGAGKTTFIKLLLRLYEPDEGTILLNGVDVKTIAFSDYVGTFSAVFQDFQLFKLTVEENIALSAKDNDSEKLWKAMEVSGFNQKIENLPKKENTHLFKDFYDDGIDLSGGEKQLLAISRAYYCDAPICVLDEPTAALDPKAEKSLYEKFGTLSEGKTMLFVSHRLSNSKNCDRILVFRDGQIIEDGTHNELIDVNGEYSELFKLQAEMYL